jgi:hypothetical protein
MAPKTAQPVAIVANNSKSTTQRRERDLLELAIPACAWLDSSCWQVSVDDMGLTPFMNDPLELKTFSQANPEQCFVSFVLQAFSAVISVKAGIQIFEGYWTQACAGVMIAAR